MRQLLRWIAFAALIGVVLPLLGQVDVDPSAPPISTTLLPGPYVAGEVLVKFKTTYPTQHRLSAIAGQGHAVVADLNQPGWVHVKISPGQTMAQALVAYQNYPDVEYVQPNYIYRATAVPNDPQYGQQWALKNIGQFISAPIYFPSTGTQGADINIEKAWDHITDCSSVVVAVIDSGVNYSQEDLAGNMWNGGVSFPNHGFDYVENDNDPMDLLGHGTHVAGIVGAVGNNSIGTTGVCQKAGIMSVRVLDATGSGTTANIIQGVNFAVSNGAKVINMSLGGSFFDQMLSDAITTAQTNDVVVVVAAGNETNNNDLGGAARFPCNFAQPNLVCVAALDQNYALANFSNWGATSVDVGAPGTNILSSFAGAVSTQRYPLTTWTISGGWTHVLNGGNDWLVDPANFFVTKYGPNRNDTATKVIGFGQMDAVTLNYSAAVNLANSGDRFVVGVDSSGANPFGAPALQDTIFGPFHTGGAALPVSRDISGCIRQVNCLIGFKLATGAATPGDFGIGITNFSIKTFLLTTNAYQLENGTSMASPEVAGLAAMLRAFNPQYTYADTVSAIKNGGRSVAALSGKTTSGKAIDVMSSLSYINPPAGLSATVQ